MYVETEGRLAGTFVGARMARMAIVILPPRPAFSGMHVQLRSSPVVRALVWLCVILGCDGLVSAPPDARIDSGRSSPDGGPMLLDGQLARPDGDAAQGDDAFTRRPDAGPACPDCGPCID